MTTIDENLNNIISEMLDFLDSLPEGITQEELIEILSSKIKEDETNWKPICTHTVSIYKGVETEIQKRCDDEKLFSELPCLKRFKNDLL